MFIVEGKEVPETLEELLVPAKMAHVVIDIQNDCCHPEGSCARMGADVSTYPGMVRNVVRLVEESRKLGVLQVFVRLIALPNGLSDSPAWIRQRRRLSIQYAEHKGARPDKEPLQVGEAGTWGAELVDELKVLPEDLLVTKHRSSAFFGTDLDMLLRSNGRDRLIFTGVATEGCVESSVRDAGFLDYFPIVMSDGVASDVPYLHEASLRVMAAYRADVIAIDTAIEAMKGAVVN